LGFEIELLSLDILDLIVFLGIGEAPAADGGEPAYTARTPPALLPLRAPGESSGGYIAARPNPQHEFAYAS